MTSDTHDVRWLTGEQQHAWRAYLVGTTLLMDRLDRDLRASHDISLPEYEVLFYSDGNFMSRAGSGIGAPRSSAATRPAPG